MDFGASSTCGNTPKNGGCGDNNNEERIRLLAEMKSKLTPMEYQVTQEKFTERPFSNRYYKHWEPGTYHCVVCNTELFKSSTKFESKSGWPAFNSVVDVSRVKLKPDLSHVGGNILLLVSRKDMARDEVSCSFCNAHLGHLFKDGPKPTGLRYCVNSNSLAFVPASANAAADTTNTNSTAGPEDLVDSNANKTCISTICINNNANAGGCGQPFDMCELKNSLPPSPALNSAESPKVHPTAAPSEPTSTEQTQASSRRSSAAAAATSPAPKSKFCLFATCLPNSNSTNSPETSPPTSKHYYKPNRNNTNGKLASARKLSKEFSPPKQVPVKKVDSVVQPPPSVPSLPETDPDFAASSSILTDQKIERISRRPSNGILRETAL